MQAATTAVLNFLGDAFCQWQLTEPGTPFDPLRALRFTVLGGLLVGPALHLWYLNLSKIIAACGLTGNAAAAGSLLLDQGVWAPFFVGTFFCALLTVEGPPELIVPKLKQDLVPAVKTNWIIWVPFQFFNFRYVPQNFQVLAANVIALVWNTYLSWASHRTVEPTPA